MACDDFGDAGADAVGIGAIDDDGGGAGRVDAGGGYRGVAGRIGAGAIPPGKHHRCAFAKVAAGDSLAQIAGGAGDQRDLACQTAG